MTLIWSESAAGQLEAIRDYIARNSPRYALAVAERIVRRAERLADMPLLGGEVPEYGDPSVREVLEYPYRIIYRAVADRVRIVAVIHGARQLPQTPPA
jgi:plasmid stabilization system protein ParE